MSLLFENFVLSARVLFRVLCVTAVVVMVILLHFQQQRQISSLLFDSEMPPPTNRTGVGYVAPVNRTGIGYVAPDNRIGVGYVAPDNRTGVGYVAPDNRTGVGYIIALDLSDQGTGAFLNLMTMLCLSSAVGGVRVVEPFIIGSKVGLNVSANWTQEVKFSDIFDSDEFHRFAKPSGYGSLVPFRKFLEDAPRKLLVAQYKCTGVYTCRSCGHEDALEQGITFSNLNGFEMVGHVCLEYGSRGMMNLEQFKNQLYSKYKMSEVAVMFPIFGGVSRGQSTEKEGFRLNMSPSNCQRNQLWKCFSNNKPSKMTVSSANNYIQGHLGGKPYISAMIRFEMVLESIEIGLCLEHLSNKLHELKSKFSIEKVVLCLDIGKYGSDYFHKHKQTYYTVLPYVNQFISQTLGEGMNLAQLDETFTNATLMKNPGFVAVMRKVIAARGDVLVLLGGRSSFQMSALELYNSLHEEKNVVKLNNSCT